MFSSPDLNRTTDHQHDSNIPASCSTPRIMVSVDRHRDREDEDENFNRHRHREEENDNFNQRPRTSTPIRPSQYSTRAVTILDNSFDEFSVEAIPADQYAILSRFDEFRRLMKAYRAEKQRSNTWAHDYARLAKQHKILQENSFRMFFGIS